MSLKWDLLEDRRRARERRERMRSMWGLYAAFLFGAFAWIAVLTLFAFIFYGFFFIHE